MTRSLTSGGYGSARSSSGKATTGHRSTGRIARKVERGRSCIRIQLQSSQTRESCDSNTVRTHTRWADEISLIGFSAPMGPLLPGIRWRLPERVGDTARQKPLRSTVEMFTYQASLVVTSGGRTLLRRFPVGGRFGGTAGGRSPARHGSVWLSPDHRTEANTHAIRSGETCLSRAVRQRNRKHKTCERVSSKRSMGCPAVLPSKLLSQTGTRRRLGHSARFGCRAND